MSGHFSLPARKAPAGIHRRVAAFEDLKRAMLRLISPFPRRKLPDPLDAVMWNREPIGGPFALTDQNGVRRTDADFRGKLMLVYFGFTYCSDVCPTDLLQMSLALDQLGQAGEMVPLVFITVDPERDTPAHLKQYMSLFHPRFVGLTGDPIQIGAAADAYRVY
jgi:cytochrome oxidase Cu insertion factor (SCO1/SenC/PrrC family)